MLYRNSSEKLGWEELIDGNTVYLTQKDERGYKIGEGKHITSYEQLTDIYPLSEPIDWGGA